MQVLFKKNKIKGDHKVLIISRKILGVARQSFRVTLPPVGNNRFFQGWRINQDFCINVRKL